MGLDLKPMLEDFVVLAKERVLMLPRAKVFSAVILGLMIWAKPRWRQR